MVVIISHKKELKECMGMSHLPIKRRNGLQNERVHRYVPHMHVHAVAGVSDIADLINQERRYYIRPHLDEAAQHAVATLMEDPDTIEGENDEFRIFDSTSIGKDSSVLDLGTAALQRIVTQMKGLRYEVHEQNFVKDAAKLGGLKGYGDYVKGVPRKEAEKLPF